MDLFSDPPSTTAATTKPKTPLQSEELASFNFLSGVAQRVGEAPPTEFMADISRQEGKGGGQKRGNWGFAAAVFGGS